MAALLPAITVQAVADPPHNTLVVRRVQNGTGPSHTSCLFDYQHGNYLGTAYAKARKRYGGATLPTASSTPAPGGVTYQWNAAYPNIVGTPAGYGPYRCVWLQTDLYLQYNGVNGVLSSNLQFGNGFVQATGPVVSYIIAGQIHTGGGPNLSTWGDPKAWSGWYPGF